MFLKLLARGIQTGTLDVYIGEREHHRFGTGEPVAEWHLRDSRTAERIARNYELQLGETYMDGAWSAGAAGLPALLTVLRSNFGTQRLPRLLYPFFRAVQQYNHLKASYRNVAQHYDLDRALFELFLDEDLHYSCAYFESDDMSLEQAQQAKCRLIASKLMLEPGARVLDIGCGWGSFARHLASRFDIEVTGVTLSREQYAYATECARGLGLDNARFQLEDYREHQGRYDRVVSIGMFEHVGRPFYLQFYQRIGELLEPDGIALLHTIGRSGPPSPTNPWIRKHIFPGGAIPSLSEMAAAAEKTGIMQTDIEVLRLHYAYTLRAWYDRFQRQRTILASRLGERFCRMWEFYLAACDVSFRYSDLVVYQQQLALRHGSVPITRDYLSTVSSRERDHDVGVEERLRA